MDDGVDVLMRVALAVLVASTAAAMLAYRFRGWAKEFFKSSRRRMALAAVASAVCPAALTVAFRLVNLNYWSGNGWLWAWCAGVSVNVFLFAVQWLVTDQLNDKIKSLTADLGSRDIMLEEKEREINELDAAFQFALLLPVGFSKAVGAKRDRLGRLDEERSALEVLEALAAQQVFQLISAVHYIFNQMINASAVAYKVRVVYYVPDDGYLKPKAGWNGQSDQCFTPFEKLEIPIQRKFELSNAEACLAVYASRTGERMLVENPEHDDPIRERPFVFFRENERTTIRSIAALPVTVDGTSRPYDVIVVDTDRHGFFSPDTGWWVKVTVENLAYRLLYEKDILEKLESLRSREEQT